MKFYTILNIDESGQPIPPGSEIPSFATPERAQEWNRNHNGDRGKILETYIGRVDIPLKEDEKGNLIYPVEKDYANIDCDYWKRPSGFSGDEPCTQWFSTFGEKPGWPVGHKFGPAA